MTQSKAKFGRAKLGRAVSAGAVAAMLAIIGMTAVMASAPVRASELQAGEAAQDDEANRQAAGLGNAAVPRPGPYASVRRDRRGEALPAPRKDFQDIK